MVDDLGRTVAVPARVRRVVSLVTRRTSVVAGFSHLRRRRGVLSTPRPSTCAGPRLSRVDPDVPADRYAAFTAPVLAYSIDDDEWVSESSVDDLAASYPNSTRRHVHPEQAGLTRVGHFGYFRPRSRALWNDPFTWLSRQPARDHH
jgi:hypothetical protein